MSKYRDANAAMSSTELPLELVLQIMCDCQDIASVVRLAATNRTMQAAWCSNTTFVVCAVFGMKDEEFQATLRLADTEASIVKQEDQAGGLGALLRTFYKFTNIDAFVPKQEQDTGPSANESDLNATVRRRLIWFQRSVDAMTALAEQMFKRHAGAAPRPTPAEYPYEAYISDYRQSYIKIRQLG